MGVIVVDQEGKVVIFNRAAEEITGFSSKGVMGKICSEHSVETGPLYELESLFVEALEKGRDVKKGEMSIKSVDGRDGGLIPLDFSLSPLKGSKGEVMGAVAVLSDPIEAKVVEARLRARDRASDLGHLASIIAHELRNPLNAIKILARLLEVNLGQPTRDDAQAVQDARSIHAQADFCEQKIKELLVFAKPGSRVEALKPKKISVNEFLEALLEDRDDRGGQFSNIELVKGFNPGIPPLFVDGERLRCILVNLIKNATDAMPDGGKLTIGTERAPGFVEIEITDTGRGFSPEEKDYIFEPLHAPEGRGTGLGLAVAQRTVLELGGTIEVESGEGQGATFRVKLPAERESPCAKKERSHDPLSSVGGEK